MAAIWRVTGSVWARLVASIVLLGVVALEVDWQTAVDRLGGGTWAWFFAAVVLLEGAFLVGALRWQRLLDGAGIDLRRWQVLRAYLIGMFSNNFLPTGFGGDAARTLLPAPPPGPPPRRPPGGRGRPPAGPPRPA